MTETQRQETVVWTTAQVIAWIRQHLDDGHTLRGGDTDGDESPTGRLACSCGVTLDVRPLLTAEPWAGVHVVSGPATLTAPTVPASATMVLVPRELVVKADSYLSLLWHRPSAARDVDLTMNVQRVIGELRAAYTGKADSR